MVFRQIAQVFVPLTTPITSSASIFQTLFAQGKIACTTPAPGNNACITAADLMQFTDPSSVFPTQEFSARLVAKPITVTHTGPNPFFTVLFSGQPDYQNPYSQQGEFGIEREIAAGFSVSASYIYVHTLKLPVAIDINLLPAPLVPAGPAGIPIRQWAARRLPWRPRVLMAPSTFLTRPAPASPILVFSRPTNIVPRIRPLPGRHSRGQEKIQSSFGLHRKLYFQ